MDSWLPILFNVFDNLYSAIIIYFELKLTQIWPVGTLSSWLHVLLTCPHHSFSISILSGTKSHSRFILPFFLPTLGVSLDSFHWGMIFRNQIWILGMLFGIGVPCSQVLSWTELEENGYIYVCVYRNMYVYMYYVYM